MNRRTFSIALAASAVARAAATSITRRDLEQSAAHAVPADPNGPQTIHVERSWKGDICQATVVNQGKAPATVKEVVLFTLPLALPLALPPETKLYGESFQMLSQTAGTLGNPVDLAYSERKHYKIPQPDDARSLFGVVTLSPPGADTMLLGFTSCRKFAGRFYLRPNSLEVVVDTEGLELAPGASWKMEEFLFQTGKSRPELLSRLATEIQRNHPTLKTPKPPTGWCSWYCFGPRVTAQNVLDNLDTIASKFPALRYVQLDDGYQPAMGDWLETGKAFGGDLKGVLKAIRTKGFEPAIWVAPFIAESGSHLFQQHPDWFIKDDAGAPLAADKVTFAGWRRGPWYALDGTHPEVQQHLEKLFRTMRQEWGCTYFKLDANFWGAMHGGHFHDAKATRIEAYRRGMEAILRGTGDSFILGCNHPIWASFGLIHGSRNSGDVSRKWTTIQKIAREGLHRNWQNGTLWWNDPDAVVLMGNLPENEFQFHATAIYASGGMILSGDDLTKISAERAAMLQKLLPPTATAASFEDESLTVGTVKLPGREMVCLFNWTDQPQTLRFQVPAAREVTDFWNGASLGRKRGTVVIEDMPAHSARLFTCKS